MTTLQPITVVELRQPRCSLRFGQYPCVAAIATNTTRTNLALYSEQFDNAAWIPIGSVVVANAVAGPDGAVVADLFRENSSTSGHSLSQLIGTVAGNQYTFSVMAKRGPGTRQLTLNATATAFGTGQRVRFDSTGAIIEQVGGATGAALDLGDGWFLLSMTTITATGTGSAFGFWLSNGTASTPSYLGDGASGWYLFGAQLEAGTPVSTYKPTTSAAVTAYWGNARGYCHNTFPTCPNSVTRARMNLNGSIRWRFMEPIGGVRFDGDFADSNYPATPAIPVAKLAVRTSPASMNPAALTEGKSPFGVTGSVTVSMADFVWDDTWGDYYKALRGALPTRTFWTTWLARNLLPPPNLELVIYDGYVGEALSAMRQRVYLVDAIEGPSGGMVTIKGSDPLRKARGKTAQFPPAEAAQLVGAISSSDTAITIAAWSESFISATHGLTGRRGIRIGSEIIEYTGYSALGGGLYSLSGVSRAVGGTVAAAASDGAKVTRCGHFEGQVLATIAKYLLTDYTPIPDAYIDTAGWAAETALWLSIGAVSDVWIPEATAVEELLGELCQQGSFMIFWDEWASLVRLKAVAPPTAAVLHLTDDNAILADSAELTQDPDARLTRAVVYYNPASWIDITKAGCRSFAMTINGDIEQYKAGNEVRAREIVGRWVASYAQAVKIITRTLARALVAPRQLTLTLDAKDRTVAVVGQVVDVTTRAFTDVDGRPLMARWLVISSSPRKSGQSYDVVLQDFGIGAPRYLKIMSPLATPTYGAATETERAFGGYISQPNGTMSDGSEGYRIS